VSLEGAWVNGNPLRSVPNFARMNRVDQLTNKFAPQGSTVNYSPGASVSGETITTNADGSQINEVAPDGPVKGPLSRIWIKNGK